MDAYTKIVFTIIAGALVVIAANMTLKPSPAVAQLGGGPTLGDWRKARFDGDPSTDQRQVASRAPLPAMSLSLLKFVGQASLVDDAMLPS